MIPFIDIQAQFARIESRVRKQIDDVFKHGQFIMGPEVAELEDRLAGFCQTRHAVVCSSGTDALLMALMAHDIGPGDLVLTSPFTFVATGEVISLLGATPVFVDVNPMTYNLDPDKLKQAIAAARKQDGQAHPLPRAVLEADPPLKPRAVISVDLFGIPADYQSLEPVCQEEGLALIEDAAQSFGARLNERPAGSFGDAGCTSFFPAKPLGGFGDSGAVLTDDRDLAQELCSIRVHGQGATKYLNRRVGLNARMDTLQAAMLLPKLDILPEELDRRQEVAQAYSTGLSGLDPHLRLPSVPRGCRSAWAQYSIRIKGRDQLQEHLRERGIPTAVYYQCPLHLQEAFAGLGYGQGDMPVSEILAHEMCSLPMHPYLPLDQVQQIVDIIGSWIQKRPNSNSLA